MMKIFSTQLTGHFSRIHEQEEEAIEDGARLLAQAAVGSGTIYVHGFGELEGITLEATAGSNPLPGAKPLFLTDGTMNALTDADRVLLFSHRSNDKEAVELAKKLREDMIGTAAVSCYMKEEPGGLEELADVHIDSKLKKALIPDEDGSRYGYPALMTSLFAYYALSFTIKEMVSEYE
ncbi:DUF2529 domain-containing protein [Metabacillus sp. SLBN-84]